MFLIFYRYPPSFPPSSPTHFLFYPFSSWTSWILSPNQLEIRKPQVNNLWSNDCLSLLHILPIEGSKISLKLASQAHIKKEMNSSQRTHTSFSFPLLPAMTLSLSHHSSSPGPFLSQPWSTEIPLPPSLPGVGSLFFGSWSQTHSLPGTLLLLPTLSKVKISIMQSQIYHSVSCPLLFLPCLLSPKMEEEKGRCDNRWKVAKSDCQSNRKQGSFWIPTSFDLKHLLPFLPATTFYPLSCFIFFIVLIWNNFFCMYLLHDYLFPNKMHEGRLICLFISTSLAPRTVLGM